MQINKEQFSDGSPFTSSRVLLCPAVELILEEDAMDFQLLEDVLKGVEAVGEKLERKNTSVFFQPQTCVHTHFLLKYSLLLPSLREIKSRGGANETQPLSKDLQAVVGC